MSENFNNVIQKAKDVWSLDLMDGLLNDKQSAIVEAIDGVLGVIGSTPEIVLAWIEEVAQELQVDLAPFLPFIHKTIAYIAIHNKAYEVLSEQLKNIASDEEDEEVIRKFVDTSFVAMSELKGEEPDGKEVRLIEDDKAAAIRTMMFKHMESQVWDVVDSCISTHVPLYSFKLDNEDTLQRALKGAPKELTQLISLAQSQPGVTNEMILNWIKPVAEEMNLDWVVLRPQILAISDYEAKRNEVYLLALDAMRTAYPAMLTKVIELVRDKRGSDISQEHLIAEITNVLERFLPLTEVDIKGIVVNVFSGKP